jgi:hypothetical protein
MWRTYLAIPNAQKPAPIFLYPVTSRKARIISERTHVQDLVIGSLAFDEINREEAASWIPVGGYATPFSDEPSDPEASHVDLSVENTWCAIVALYQAMQDTMPLLTDVAALLEAYHMQGESSLVDRHMLAQLRAGNTHNSPWEIVRQEAARNAWLGSQMNTVEKLIQLRKDELCKKIALLSKEYDAYKATLPPLEREIEQESAAIEEQRSAFRAYMRRVIQLLIDDPGPLGEKRIPKESDIKGKLLNLPKRQALVRVGGDIDQKPRKYTMKTDNLPQAAKKDEVERRLRQIREQTRTKYCRPRSEVEQELRYTPDASPKKDEEHHEESFDSWYEE